MRNRIIIHDTFSFAKSLIGNLIVFIRSNKGASKQRRDQINAEISVMRDLLPLPESARQRLSQLQIMSLSCVFIRKCNILQKRKLNLNSELEKKKKKWNNFIF